MQLYGPLLTVFNSHVPVLYMSFFRYRVANVHFFWKCNQISMKKTLLTPWVLLIPPYPRTGLKSKEKFCWHNKKFSLECSHPVREGNSSLALSWNRQKRCVINVEFKPSSSCPLINTREMCTCLFLSASYEYKFLLEFCCCFNFLLLDKIRMEFVLAFFLSIRFFKSFCVCLRYQFTRVRNV